LKFYNDLPANTDYYLTLTTQNGNGVEGINFPSQPGEYKIEIEVEYHKNSAVQTNAARFIQVYGERFTNLIVSSTVNIPS